MSLTHARTFRELLKHYRLMAGLSQEDLAARAGLSPRGISDLERGVRRVPRPSTLTLLAEALGLPPSDRATLLAAARAPDRPADRLPAPSSAALPRLVGRVHELALLERHLASEGPPLLLLAGEPGIGKSRLLREAAQQARAGGWTLLESGCTRRGGQEPYAPLLAALAGRLHQQPQAQLRRELEGCGWLVRLLPELAETTLVPAPSWTLAPEQERRLMFAAAGRFLTNVAGPAGTLLVLDDLQWAGPDALDLLAALVRAAGTPLRVVGAYRNTEVRPSDPLAITSADLARDGLVAQTDIGLLTRPEAEELLGALLAAGEEQTVVEQIVERSGGVPFFLVSCARGLRQGALAGGTAEGVPWDAAQSIRLRVAALPQAAQELLGVAAVIGRQVSAALLGSVTGRPEGELLDLLEGICESRLLKEQDADAYEFAHDLIREVVEGDLTAARRKGLHRRVAEAMERDATEYRAEALAFHFEHGGEPERAVRCLERAAERATRMGAFAEAQHLLQHAIALAPGEEHARLYEQAGDSVLQAVGYQLYRAAFRCWHQDGARDPLVGARLVRKILFACIRALVIPRPSAEELADLQTQARRLAETIDDEAERWRLLVAARLPPIWREQVAPAEASEARSVALAAAAYFEARGEWASFSMVLDGFTNVATGAELIEVSKRRLSAPDLPVVERADALGSLACGYFRTGDFGRSIAIMRGVLEHVRSGESLEPFVQAARYAVFAAWLSGRWGEIDDIVAAIEGVLQKEMSPGVYWMALLVAMPELLVAMAREDDGAADATAAMVERGGRSEVAPFYIHTPSVQALHRAYRRDDPALIEFDPARRPQGDTSPYVLWELMFLCERGVTALGALIDLARARTARYEVLIPCLTIAEALAAGDDARLAAAIDDAEAHGLIPHAARMRIILAQRTGDRAQLERARPVLERLGDRRFLRRLEAVAATLPG